MAEEAVATSTPPETRGPAMLDELYGALFEHSIDCVLITRPDGTIIRANPAACRAYGLSEAEVCRGRRADRLVDDAAARAFLQEREQTGAARGELTARRGDGSLFPVVVSSSVIQARSGEFYTFIIFRDITEEKRAERELREREAELRLAQRIAHVGSWSWTVGTGTLDASEEVCRIYGRDPGEPIPLNDSEELRRHYTAEGWQRRAAAFRKALTDGLPWERDEEIIRADGSVRWVHFRGEAERDGSGLIVKLRGTIEDITDRKRTEEALARSEAAFAHAGKLARFGAWWVEIGDAGAMRVQWSDEVYRIFGYEPGEVEVSSELWAAHVHPEDRDRVSSAIASAVGSREPYAVEHRVVRRDGTELVVAAHAEVRPGAGGQPTMMIGAVQDITERKRIEQDLRDADRRKDAFLGMLSHELRNPLAPIRNSVYILEHADTTGEQASRARSIIKRQTEHLTRLVDDLLDVTRIARGKIELRRSRVDLREVVWRAADDFRLMMDERGVAFHTVFPAARLWADADATRITQIVGNLLHNAAKFTRRGDEVTLSLRCDGGQAEIRVRDTGAGIEPALLPTIFDAFVQGERTLARTEGGLGLGLALVKGLTELHGGAVRAGSAGTGQGAEFVIRLPVVAAAGVQIIAVSGHAHPEDVRRAIEAGLDGHVAKRCDPEEIERLLG